MSEEAPKRWFGLRRKVVLIAAAVIIAIELPVFVLALNSTIPCHWAWNSQDGTVRVMRLYWDGRTEIREYPRTAGTLVAECTIWFAMSAITAVAGYVVYRWLKEPWHSPISMQRLLAWVLAATILISLASALAAFLER